MWYGVVEGSGGLWVHHPVQSGSVAHQRALARVTIVTANVLFQVYSHTNLRRASELHSYAVLLSHDIGQRAPINQHSTSASKDLYRHAGTLVWNHPSFHPLPSCFSHMAGPYLPPSRSISLTLVFLICSSHGLYIPEPRGYAWQSCCRVRNIIR